MAVITISRQLGSHGARIARGLARELGWKLADKATINAVIEQYGLIRLDEIYGDEAPSFWDLYTQDSVWTIEWMNKTIEAISAGQRRVLLVMATGIAAVAAEASFRVGAVLVAAHEILGGEAKDVWRSVATFDEIVAILVFKLLQTGGHGFSPWW